jgi:hypothetical protein
MRRTGDPNLLVLLFSLEAKAFMACRFDDLSGLETGSCMRAAKSALSSPCISMSQTDLVQCKILYTF